MLREIGLFGALVPSLLFYFLAAVALFLLVNRLASRLGLFRFFWHPPLDGKHCRSELLRLEILPGHLGEYCCFD